ncbi:MAG: hypothetical protein SFY56_15870 [Bacteroidota bacterium]|nr:hypothetical protein [Bacteroidota bacterium]
MIGKQIVSFNSKAVGKLEIVEGKYMISEISLPPGVALSNERDKEKSERVLNKSEVNGLISNSVKSKQIFNPEIKIV